MRVKRKDLYEFDCDCPFRKNQKRVDEKTYSYD
jgi:hypothetical protein